MPRSGDSVKPWCWVKLTGGTINGQYALVLSVAVVQYSPERTALAYSPLLILAAPGGSTQGPHRILYVGIRVTISVSIGTLIPETVHKYTPHALSVFPDVLTAIHFLHHCVFSVCGTPVKSPQHHRWLTTILTPWHDCPNIFFKDNYLHLESCKVT